MNHDESYPKRRSIRLAGYDYSQIGAYFVTVCVQDRLCLFGDVIGDSVHLNDAGRMIERWWRELTNKFYSLQIGKHVVMPNHFHGILIITDVGAALRGRPDAMPGPTIGRPHGAVPTLGVMIDWFQTMTTNEYIRMVRKQNWRPFQRRLWQRNYYEHIIRNEDDLNRIREYIALNPARWAWDRENPGAVVRRTPDEPWQV